MIYCTLTLTPHNIASKNVKEKVIEAPLVFENIDWRRAMIYFALTLTPHNIVDQKLQQIMPKNI